MPKGALKRELVTIKNPDKKHHEQWSRTRDIFDFPRPFRWIITGLPNSGKTSLILNYLIHSSPYERIFILHPKSFNPCIELEVETKNEQLVLDKCEVPEYVGVEAFYLTYIPSETFWDNLSGHSLLIVDDIDLASFTRKNSMRTRVINKTWSYCSTHNNLSIITTSQSPSTQLLPIIFQMSNVISIYPQQDLYKIRVLAQKLSIDSKALIYYMKFLKSPHDNLTVDMTQGTPAKLRRNIYETLQEVEF